MCPWEVERYYLQGADAIERTSLTSGQVGIALEAVEKFTYRDWNGALLTAWIFIESIINLYLGTQQNVPQLRNIKNKIDFLLESGELEVKLGQSLHRYRQYRNSLVHNGVNVDKSSIDDILPSIRSLGSCLFQAGIYTNRQGGTKPGVSSPNLPWE